MKKLFLCLVFLFVLFSHNAYAEEEGSEYPRFRVLLESGECIEGKNGYFDSSVFNGISKNGEEISVGKNDISAIQVPSGSMAGVGALAGAGIGLLITNMVISSTEGHQQDLLMGAGIIIPIGAGITALTTLIGGVLGANKTTWEEVPINTTFNFGVQEKGVSLSVSIPFD